MSVGSAADRRARLARRHLLLTADRVETMPEVADRLVGLHSSDPATVYLSTATRLRSPAPADVDHALYDRRSVIRHHAMRRTLWVFTPEVARLAHASCTLALVGAHRRALGKLLVDNGATDDPDRWLDDAIAATSDALAERGQATTRELGEAVPSLRAPLTFASGKTYGGTIAAHTRVLTLMGFMGLIVRARPLGTWISGQYRWAITEDWIEGGLGGEEADRAAAVLVEQYLRTFGPVSPIDVRWWTGWTKRKTDAALRRAGAISLAPAEGPSLLVAHDDTGSTPDPGPWVAVLPGLDPTTMGWKEREWYLDQQLAPALFDRNGNAGPTIWADGRIVGGWAQRPDGELVHRLLVPIDRAHERLLDDELERIRSFLGDTRFTIRFPSPLSRELVAG